jgi:flagellar biosynthetic protein FlhB
LADDTEKSEAPTPRRRQEARSRGQIPKSQDLTAAVLLLVGLVTLDLFGESILNRLHDMTKFMLSGGGVEAARGSQLIPLSAEAMKQMFMLLLPILLVFMFAALVVVMLQTGLLFTLHPLKWSLEKISPLGGIKKLVSAHSVVMLLINIAKLGIVGSVVYFSVVGELNRIMYSSSLVFTEVVRLGIEIFFSLGIRVAAILIVLGLLDWLYQRFKHERGLRMSKEEVKEEMRSMDGDPMMKRRRREVQMQIAMQRLRHDVPQADVVVTNPTHLAVALKYDTETMTAPRVLAKGKDRLAERIRMLAIEAGVPIVERKPLARVLYKLVEVGEEVPPHLYKAVAEVLAYVYELSGKRQAMRAAAGMTA